MPKLTVLPLRTVCAECGSPLPAAKGTGRRRMTCTDKCRQARRRRRRFVPWPPVPTDDYPTDPKAVRERTAAALVSLMEGDQAAPPEDQLAQGLLELDWLAYRFEMLERNLPRRLAARSGDLGRHIREMRRRLFPIEEAV